MAPVDQGLSLPHRWTLANGGAPEIPRAGAIGVWRGAATPNTQPVGASEEAVVLVPLSQGAWVGRVSTGCGAGLLGPPPLPVHGRVSSNEQARRGLFPQEGV